MCFKTEICTRIRLHISSQGHSKEARADVCASAPRCNALEYYSSRMSQPRGNSPDVDQKLDAGRLGEDECGAACGPATDAPACASAIGDSRKAGYTQPHVLQLACFKTQLCRYFSRGGCSRGEECMYAHGRQELRTTPDLAKTSLCKEWVLERCRYSPEECRYAHGSAYLTHRVKTNSQSCGSLSLPSNRKSTRQGDMELLDADIPDSPTEKSKGSKGASLNGAKTQRVVSSSLGKPSDGTRSGAGNSHRSDDSLPRITQDESQTSLSRLARSDQVQMHLLQHLHGARCPVWLEVPDKVGSACFTGSSVGTQRYVA